VIAAILAVILRTSFVDFEPCSNLNYFGLRRESSASLGLAIIVCS
jgi:hypothetical protein